ncbi:DNA cytosine methyltransferase [Planctomyces sp. SH-PL62]|uniref:DNA cytosine methyltransferase n=1 Tax=Planctomyces sp. SH-PL62 TaxID=1636152 RepID=UPI00078BAEAB|nr:DNA (cytosine-5-)-methyltransferase [Planctomyces sp. SH-PL62]AMV35836.1 Modification methylase HhaI [Planctomyces sp. SH-PL62]
MSDAADKTFCEFFAGIGLVREALGASGWSCVYANDVDPKKQGLYLGRFGDEGHFHLGDVWETPEVVSRIEGSPLLATASFPCVDLSLAGNGRGFEGTHSSTFFGFVRAMETLAERCPRLVLLENVTGFLTSSGGKDFEAAARALAGLGYRLDAFTLDAAMFVPQSRPRVFVVGVRADLDPPGAVRRAESGWIVDAWEERLESADRRIRPRKLIELMRAIDLPTGWIAFDVPAPGVKPPDVAEVIDRDDAQDWWDAAAVSKHRDMMHDRHRERVDAMVSSGETFIGTIYRRKRDGRTRAEVRFDGVAGCLRTPRGGSAKQIVIVVEAGRLRMRWMSPREYARLQGAPDFPLVANTIQNLFGFGDAVCVPAVQWIDRHVLSPVAAGIAELRRTPGGRQPDARATSADDAGGQRQEHVA